MGRGSRFGESKSVQVIALYSLRNVTCHVTSFGKVSRVLHRTRRVVLSGTKGRMLWYADALVGLSALVGARFRNHGVHQAVPTGCS